MSSNWKQTLLQYARGKIVIVGVGNRLRGDDAIGSLIVDNLSKLTDYNLLFDCETAPENFISPITRANPDSIIIVDGAVLDAEPGTIQAHFSDQLPRQAEFITHFSSITSFTDLLYQYTTVNSLLLLVSVKHIEWGTALSEECKKATEEICEALLETLDYRH